MSSTGQGAVADAPRLTCAGELGEWGRVGVGEGQKRNASECDSVCATKSASSSYHDHNLRYDDSILAVVIIDQHHHQVGRTMHIVV